MNALLTLLVLLAPVACRSAQDADDDGVVRVRTAQPGYSQVVATGDEGTLILFLRGGEDVTAILDGAVVPPDRIVRDGDRLRVVSPEGETMFDVRVAGADGVLGLRVRTNDAGGSGSAAFWEDFVGAGVLPSRKLIGVTTTPVDAALAAQLDIDADEAFVINQVNRDMPAEKAGVKPWDVVVRIDGEGPGTVEHLREALRDKEEGQTVRLTILRKRETLDLEVGFTQYAVGSSMGLGGGSGRYVPDQLQARADLSVRTALHSAMAKREAELATLQAALQDARARIEASVVALQDAEAAARGEDGPVDEAHLKALRAAVERAQTDAAAAAERLQAARLGAGFLDLGDDGGRALFVPQTYSAASALQGRADAEDQRLVQLEERLARLEELLKELVESDKER